jgi:hypothetical protein
LVRSGSVEWRGHHARHGDDDGEFYDRQEKLDAMELVLYQGIRRDLGVVPSTVAGGPLPGSGWSSPGETSDAGSPTSEKE